MADLRYELVVVGGGAGGIAAALAAARLGVKTLLIERENKIGGTAVQAGVSIWEMGVSGTGISRDIYDRLAQIPDAVGIYTAYNHCCWPKVGVPTFPGGQFVVDPDRTYADTLRRYGTNGYTADGDMCREIWHGVPFEPLAFALVVRKMLEETGCCDVWTDSEVVDISTGNGRIFNCKVRRGDAHINVTGDVWIDGTGDASLCAMAGCRMMFGTESRDDFSEPDAPLAASTETNGVTLIYRVSSDSSKWLTPPSDLPNDCWWNDKFPVANVVEYPNGDWNMNMLPTMEGETYYGMTAVEAYQECVRRVWAHWKWTQQAWPEFAGYGISWIAPKVGVREGPRVIGEYVLTEQDVLGGISQQMHKDIIAIADHAVDIHNTTESNRCSEPTEPYGIPFRCLIPKGWQNLLLACRGASFTHIAGASCRLTRTMMQIGQAAGTSVALAKEDGCVPREIASEVLRKALVNQGVVLDYRELLQKGFLTTEYTEYTEKGKK